MSIQMYAPGDGRGAAAERRSSDSVRRPSSALKLSYPESSDARRHELAPLRKALEGSSPAAANVRLLITALSRNSVNEPCSQDATAP